VGRATSLLPIQWGTVAKGVENGFPACGIADANDFLLAPAASIAQTFFPNVRHITYELSPIG
jgi:hypothetical protein